MSQDECLQVIKRYKHRWISSKEIYVIICRKRKNKDKEEICKSTMYTNLTKLYQYNPKVKRMDISNSKNPSWMWRYNDRESKHYELRQPLFYLNK